MGGPLVAFARKLDAIDLTASLWLSSFDEDLGGRDKPRVLWIADARDTYRTVQSDLGDLAEILRPRFDIEVASYAEAWSRSSFNSPPDLYIRVRDDALRASKTRPCRIRIHHGTFELRSLNAPAVTSVRCLELDDGSDSFRASPSGRTGSWFHASPQEIVGISGSLHLYLAQDIGEVVNLPWYALSPGIGCFDVRESISPITCYSLDRYANGAPKLDPSGYSLIDYPLWLERCLGSSALRTRSIDVCRWLTSEYPRTSTRIGPRARGSAELVCKLYTRTRRQLIAGEVLIESYDGLLRSSLSADSVSSLVVISIIARTLEGVDRGHEALITEELRDNVMTSLMLDTPTPATRDLLMDTYYSEVRRAAETYPRLAEMLRWKPGGTRFGDLARACFAAAVACAELALLDIAVDLKASVPALVRFFNGDGCARAFESLRTIRPNDALTSASGSILSYAR